jgi:2-keto-3-deoxy-L-rhamnonate aldolase RhmA
MDHARNLLVLAQVESPQSLDAAEDILSRDGIDGLFIGVEDLKLRLGIDPSAGALETPKIREAMERVAQAAGKTGKFASAIARTPDMLHTLVEMGYRLISCGGDSPILKDASARLLETMR